MFRAAKQSRIFQDVVEQIQETILSGELRPGDILPPERELKAVLQVSRGTLREALRVLEQKGLIEIRLGVGGGAVVKDVTYDNVGESLALLIRSQKISLAHLAEFRRGVEGDVAALAARRAGPQDVERLNRLIAKAKIYVEKGEAYARQFIAVDKQLHLALAKITANPVYESLHHTVHDNIDQYYINFLKMGKAELEENLRDLCAIVSAVADRRIGDARTLARQHVLRFNHYKESAEKTVPPPVEPNRHRGH